jgi:hypothetical protein
MDEELLDELVLVTGCRSESWFFALVLGSPTTSNGSTQSRYTIPNTVALCHSKHIFSGDLLNWLESFILHQVAAGVSMLLTTIDYGTS